MLAHRAGVVNGRALCYTARRGEAAATTLAYTVLEADEGMRLSSVILRRMGVSHGLLSRVKFQGELMLDGRPAHADAIVRAGQRVELTLPTDGGPALLPYPLALRVLYEDGDLLAVEKPAPLPSVCSRRQDGLTLENAVYSYFGCPADFLYRPVNRLDKGTSGLMLIAKHAHAQNRLQQLLHTDAFVREYLAVVEGAPDPPDGRIDLPLRKANGPTVRRVVAPDGKPAVTEYRTLSRGNGRSLLALRLQTGRTHQIRVHLQALGHPVCGDFLYGTELPELPGRFALHSCRVLLTHPTTGERLALESPLPPELAALLAAPI